MACLAVFMSCEDYLEPVPDSRITTDTFFNTDEDVLAGILGVYDAIQGVPEEAESNSSNFNRGVQFEYLLTEMRDRQYKSSNNRRV